DWHDRSQAPVVLHTLAARRAWHRTAPHRAAPRRSAHAIAYLEVKLCWLSRAGKRRWPDAGSRCGQSGGVRGEHPMSVGDLDVGLAGDADLLDAGHQALLNEAVEIIRRGPYVGHPQARAVERGNVELGAARHITLPVDQLARLVVLLGG